MASQKPSLSFFTPTKQIGGFAPVVLSAFAQDLITGIFLQCEGATCGREDKTSRFKLSVSHFCQVLVRACLGPLVMRESLAVDLRVVRDFLAHLVGLFPPPIITVHLAHTFGWC